MKKVLLLLAEGFEFYEASVFIDVIGWNLIDGDGSTQLFTCAIKKEINSSFNQRMVVDYTLDQIKTDDFDALALPGGFVEFDFYRDAYDEQFMNIIKQFHQQGKWIASVCAGALPIGKSGILNGKKGTTYNKNNGIRQITLRSYGCIVENSPIVIDANIITSWNPSTAIDVAFCLLEKLTSIKQADYIRDIMGFQLGLHL
jgi:4-methyl-5(b-hydroxyethyl)-thiazole monophosphate biosynthesis